MSTIWRKRTPIWFADRMAYYWVSHTRCIGRCVALRLCGQSCCICLRGNGWWPAASARGGFGRFHVPGPKHMTDVKCWSALSCLSWKFISSSLGPFGAMFSCRFLEVTVGLWEIVSVQICEWLSGSGLVRMKCDSLSVPYTRQAVVVLDFRESSCGNSSSVEGAPKQNVEENIFSNLGPSNSQMFAQTPHGDTISDIIAK